MNDRFIRGFIAGSVGLIPAVAFNMLVYRLGISPLRFLDFAAVMIYGGKAANIWETVFAWATAMFLTAALGIIFAFLVTVISSRYLLFKSIIFGTGMWFIFYSINVLYKVPELENISLGSAVSNFIGSGIWGLSMGYALSLIDKKFVSRKQDSKIEAFHPKFILPLASKKQLENDDKQIKLKKPIKLK